jgi:hypothetical protein
MEALGRSLDERFAAAVAERRRASASMDRIGSRLVRLIGKEAAAACVRAARQQEARALREPTPPPRMPADDDPE